VNISKLVGANRSYIEQEIPHISSLMRTDMQAVLDHSDTLLVAHQADGFDQALKKLRPDQAVLDLVRIPEGSTDTGGLYEGISW
jgi:GDP-mannose 6-dehydrogenase